jgi:hypothetical protein
MSVVPLPYGRNELPRRLPRIVAGPTDGRDGTATKSVTRARDESREANMTTAHEVDDLPAVNLSVVCGRCSAVPEIRVLESGSRLASLALRCPADGDRATSVPVTVWDPPAWVESLAPGDAVVVVGRLRRRFYQRAGGVGARVDVEADLIGRARDRRRRAAALEKAEAALDALA